MSLTPEQKQSVAQWVSDGASLSEVQKQIQDEFKVSMTYMDVRFLVDDLDVTLVDRTPSPDASDVSKSPPPPAAESRAEKKGFIDKAKEKLGMGGNDDDDAVEEPLPVGEVTVEVDNATLIPNAMASGSVTFSDGVTGKWIVDNYGRPGFTEISQEGYRPSPEDAEAFMQQLGAALQKKGLA